MEKESLVTHMNVIIGKPKYKIHFEKGGLKKANNILIVYHVVENDEGNMKLLNMEDYWNSSRIYVGFHKNGTIGWIISTVDSGEGSTLFNKWLQEKDIEPKMYRDAKSLIESGNTPKIKKDVYSAMARFILNNIDNLTQTHISNLEKRIK